METSEGLPRALRVPRTRKATAAVPKMMPTTKSAFCWKGSKHLAHFPGADRAKSGRHSAQNGPVVPLMHPSAVPPAQSSPLLVQGLKVMLSSAHGTRKYPVRVF